MATQSRKAVKPARQPKPQSRSNGRPRQDEDESRGPVDKIKLYPVDAAIWANTTESGQTMYSASFQRSYKTRDGEWKRSTSFSGTDLLVLAEAARQAYSKIDRMRKLDREESQPQRQDFTPDITDDDVPF